MGLYLTETSCKSSARTEGRTCVNVGDNTKIIALGDLIQSITDAWSIQKCIFPPL